MQPRRRQTPAVQRARAFRSIRGLVVCFIMNFYQEQESAQVRHSVFINQVGAHIVRHDDALEGSKRMVWPCRVNQGLTELTPTAAQQVHSPAAALDSGKGKFRPGPCKYEPL